VSIPWSVVIHQDGRSGRIDYREGDRLASVDWEFGGDDVVVIIMTTSSDEWDQLYPWAAGRQTEILRRIGPEVVAQKARGCVVDLDPRAPRYPGEPRWLLIREPPKTPYRG
jgi:hypothetical protein